MPDQRHNRPNRQHSPPLPTYTEWEDAMKSRYDTLPAWWWAGRTRRLAEYGAETSAKIRSSRQRRTENSGNNS